MRCTEQCADEKCTVVQRTGTAAAGRGRPSCCCTEVGAARAGTGSERVKSPVSASTVRAQCQACTSSQILSKCRSIFWYVSDISSEIFTSEYLKNISTEFEWMNEESSSTWHGKMLYTLRTSCENVRMCVPIHLWPRLKWFLVSVLICFAWG